MQPLFVPLAGQVSVLEGLFIWNVNEAGNSPEDLTTRRLCNAKTSMNSTNKLWIWPRLGGVVSSDDIGPCNREQALAIPQAGQPQSCKCRCCQIKFFELFQVHVWDSTAAAAKRGSRQNARFGGYAP